MTERGLFCLRGNPDGISVKQKALRPEMRNVRGGRIAQESVLGAETGKQIPFIRKISNF